MSVDCMLISMLPVYVKALEMLCAEAAEELAPQACDLNPGELFSHLCLMSHLRNPNSVSSSDGSPSLSGPVQTLIASSCQNVSFATLTRS